MSTYVPDPQCTNTCITIQACDKPNPKYPAVNCGLGMQQCIEQCTAGKHDKNTIWPNMVSVYGNSKPYGTPPFKCEDVHNNMKPQK